MGYILSFKIDINMSQIQANKITKENTHTHTRSYPQIYQKWGRPNKPKSIISARNPENV